MKMAAYDNPMREVRLEKVVINMGIGDKEDTYTNAKTLIEKLTGRSSIQTRSKKRAPEFKIRKDQVIGAMVTLRGQGATDMLKRALDANNNTLYESSVANNSLNFGVSEYIYFSGVKYDPKIGMMGLNLNATFSRRGRRVEIRKRKAAKVAPEHRNIAPEDIRKYIESKFGAKFVPREG